MNVPSIQNPVEEWRPSSGLPDCQMSPNCCKNVNDTDIPPKRSWSEVLQILKALKKNSALTVSYKTLHSNPRAKLRQIISLNTLRCKSISTKVLRSLAVYSRSPHLNLSEKRLAMKMLVSRNLSTQFTIHVSVFPSSLLPGLSTHFSQHISVKAWIWAQVFVNRISIFGPDEANIKGMSLLIILTFNYSY